MDYFAITTKDGTVLRLPFPMDLPLTERADYMAAALAAHTTTAPAKPRPSED